MKPARDEEDPKLEEIDGIPDMTARQMGTQRLVSRPRFVVRHAEAHDSEFQPHSHTMFTITAILSGTMKATIGEQELELAAGDTAFTNIGEWHSGRTRRVEFVSIGVTAGVINELIAELGLIGADAEVVFRSSVVRDPALIQTARTLATEIEDEKLGHATMLDAVVRQLAIHLLRSHLTVRRSARIEFSRAGPVDRRLRRAVEFMHDNYSRELSLEEIAEAAYLSEYHFARLFKQITGVTPHVYLASLRLEGARKLLAETVLPIGQIASMVGYQSQSHFTKIFKSVTGVTPRTYREGATAKGGENVRG
jgi:AraC family transcriptional regulator